MQQKQPEKKPKRAAAPGKNLPEPRHLAILLLSDIMLGGATLDDAWAKRLVALNGLEARDQAFARALVMAVLRHAERLDRVTRQFLKRVPAGHGQMVLMLLRLALAQHLFLGLPDHAVVNSTVELAHRLKLSAFSGLINAITRKLVQEGAARLEKTPPDQGWPSWLLQSWTKAYGAQQTQAIIATQAQEPPLDIVIKETPAPTDWAEKLQGQWVAPQVVRLARGCDITQLPGYGEGAWWVQDLAAQWPIRLLGDVAGSRGVDLCAAPGGKTMQLAAAGAEVWAVDRSASRMLRLQDNLARTGLSAHAITADALEWQPPCLVDWVVLDAPCSATGTLRRHPDIRWHRSNADVASLADLQQQLLRHAAGMLRPGGQLLYITCSLEAAEGPALISSMAQDGSLAALGLTLCPLDAGKLAVLQPDPELPQPLLVDGFFRTIPALGADKGGMDGFFAALLTRQ